MLEARAPMTRFGAGSSIQELPRRLGGAPLDLVKLAAAALMLADHVNSGLLGGSVQMAWRLGRIAFPLFCFVLACHLLRGIDLKRYLQVVLIVAIATQPFFSAAFPWNPVQGNVLFTLAAGAALAMALARRSAWVRHLVFAAGLAAVLAWPLRARTGVDFGLAGMLLPGAILLCLAGARAQLVWLPALVFALNAGLPREAGAWLHGAVLDALFAGLGSVLVIGCAAMAQGLPRFLPRYALHVFYPAHLVALAGLRALGVGG